MRWRKEKVSQQLWIELKPTYFVVFAFIFGLCLDLFWLAQMLRQQLKVQYSCFPYLITGFEYGTLGINLFGSAYGLEKMGYIAITVRKLNFSGV